MKKIFEVNPKKVLFFYGYLILFAGAIGAIMSAPGQTIGVSSFTDHLIEAFKISRVQLSITYLIGTTASAVLLTFGGKLYDKYGARFIAPIAGIGLGIFLLFLTQVDKMSYSVFSITSIPVFYTTFAFLIIGFLGIRFFGQGMLTMISRNMVMKWFDKRRGLASAVFGVAMVMGFSVVPKIFSSSIEVNGWRLTWQITAFVAAVCFSIFAYLLFRDNPQKYGLKPDGYSSKLTENKQNKKQKIIATGYDFELKDAIKTYSFWIFTLAMTLFALYITAFTFHIEDIFVSAGLNKKDAFSIFIPTAIIAVGIQLVAGWAADFIKLKFILLVSLLGIILSTIGTIFLKPGPIIWVIIIGNSLAQGVFGVLSSVTWPRFFGIKNLGAISGFAVSWTVAGSAIGPLLFSFSKTISINYTFALIVCGIIGIILFILGIKADNASEQKVKLT